MEQTKKKESQIKLLLLGDQAVGKSSLMTRYSEDEFLLNIMGTAGLDLKKKNLQIEGQNLKVMIYDTAGHDRYRFIATSQYKGSEGIVLVYDVTDRKSFDNVSYWMNHIKENADTGVEILLVGNKIDREAERTVNLDEGRDLSIKYSVLFAETSAKSGDGVEAAFFKLITKIHNNEKAKVVGNVTNINNKDKKKSNSKCC